MMYVLFVRDNFVCSPAGEFLFCSAHELGSCTSHTWQSCVDTVD
jgi:hypothetical protein